MTEKAIELGCDWIGQGPSFASTPTEFAKFIAAETEKWGKVIRTAGIKAE